ncbi:hypothetical protein [Photobacterium kasasachensis]|uniref:hypothetical protein n=1 Tax=Photobacterium kasasachensis TaxID=2910240 RepID=UPI003D0B2984
MIVKDSMNCKKSFQIVNIEINLLEKTNFFQKKQQENLSTDQIGLLNMEFKI